MDNYKLALDNYSGRRKPTYRLCGDGVPAADPSVLKFRSGAMDKNHFSSPLLIWALASW